MIKKFSMFDFGAGDIQHIDDAICFTRPLIEQIGSLREDLLQVHYNNGVYILDVGWYPSFNSDGHFLVVVVFQMDWTNPLSVRYAKDFDELKNVVIESVSLIQELSSKGSNSC